MKGLMIFANGFEDVEGIATMDILNRANIPLTCATVDKNLDITTASKNKICFKISLKDIDYQKYDFLILPGGPAVLKVLDQNPLVNKVIIDFCNHQKLVCAICAAPYLIGKYGYFKDIKFTCFPGFDENIKEGILSEKSLVHSKNFITARSMYYTCDFALEIVSTLKGNDVAVAIAKQIKGLN